jgi:hypothetical protein
MQEKDEIDHLCKTTTGANGLAIFFKRNDYRIPAHGKLTLIIEWTKSISDFKTASPCLILPRSEFAVSGITASLDDNDEIVLQNNSSTGWLLGDRFIQLLVPMCFQNALDLTLLDNLAVTSINNSDEEPIPSTFLDVTKKNRFDLRLIKKSYLKFPVCLYYIALFIF